jgi:AraC-like DNA-binding protein
MESASSSERIACVESFLLQKLRQDREDPVFSQASSWLRRDPGLRMRKLASLLDISERHLTRGFRATFGTSPKQYARLARIEKVIAARKRGLGWAEVAYACGFTDQAERRPNSSVRHRGGISTAGMRSRAWPIPTIHSSSRLVLRIHWRQPQRGGTPPALHDGAHPLFHRSVTRLLGRKYPEFIR